MKKPLLSAVVFASLLSPVFAGLEETIDFGGLDLPSITDSREMDRFHKSGCGFFITKDGCLITDKHLIADAKTILVVYGNKAYEADVVTLKRGVGFALLRVRKCEGVQPVVFSQTRACRSGDKFLLAANSVSNEHGIIPAIQRGVVSDVLKETYRLYVPTAREHVGAPIGNAGGDVEGMLLDVGKHGQNFNSALCASVIRAALPPSVKRGLSFEVSRVSDSNAAMQRLSCGVATVLVYNSEARAKAIRDEGREGEAIKKVDAKKLQLQDVHKLTRRAKEKKTHYSGNGSGFFVTDDGYLITNHHVVEGAEEIVLVHADKSHPARIVAKNKEKDLVLLKAEGVFRPLAIAGSNTCEVGQGIFTVGYPKIDLQGLSVKVTKGIVSSLTGFRDEGAQAQIDAPIQPGNSGGPVVNEEGRVVGVAVAKLRHAENVNYMIKTDELLAFLPKGVRSAINRHATPKQGSNMLKAVTECVALVICYDKGSGSTIDEMASGADRKRLAREIRRAVLAARMAKLDEKWARVEEITDDVLSYDFGNAEARALNDEAKTHLGRHLMIRAVVNENEVRAKIVPVMGFKRPYNSCEQPIELFDKDRKKGYPVVAKLLYSTDGVKYEGMLETVYDWSGMKEVTVRLVEVR